MNLKRCANGHFYDVDKYMSCPHCQGAPGQGYDEDMAATERYTETQQGATIPETVKHTSVDSGMDYTSIPETSGRTTGETNSNSLTGILNCMQNSSIPIPEENESVTQRFYPNDMKIEPVVGWLVCIRGADAGKNFDLKSGRNFIGRSSSMDVVIAGDQSISREKHAIILYEPRKREFIVQQGDSRELFYVNDEVVLNNERLNPYDKILIGQTELLFVPFCCDKFAWEDIDKEE